MGIMRRDVSLRAYNTFGVEAKAARYLEVATCEELRGLLPWQEGPLLLLGGGSNILLTGDVSALVIRNCIMGKEIIESGERSVLVGVGGGESWPAFVEWCVGHDFGGVENLSLIPGTVGAAPIQNIGAYGVEFREVFEKLEAVELATGRLRVFDEQDCRFAYRDSIFKQEGSGRFFVTRVYLRLSRAPFHRINTAYGAIRSTLEVMGIARPDIRQVSAAVVRIRKEKLPDPAVLGNAGSFFKNPVIPEPLATRLKMAYPGMVSYPAGEGMVKVPAGWLIESCGWKGFRHGNVGCYEKQALVLVNYGGASGKEIEELSRRIADSVKETFGILLETEVNII